MISIDQDKYDEARWAMREMEIDAALQRQGVGVIDASEAAREQVAAERALDQEALRISADVRAQADYQPSGLERMFATEYTSAINSWVTGGWADTDTSEDVIDTSTGRVIGSIETRPDHQAYLPGRDRDKRRASRLLARSAGMTVAKAQEMMGVNTGPLTDDQVNALLDRPRDQSGKWLSLDEANRIRRESEERA